MTWRPTRFRLLRGLGYVAKGGNPLHVRNWRLKRIAISLSLLSMSGCASASTDYRAPSGSVQPNYTKTVNRSKDQVWNDAVVALGQRFFVINNLDKASGLINISYSGDPSRFVDCGSFTVTISGLNAKTQNMDGAASDAQYEWVAPVPPYGFPGSVQIRRQMSLEGRVNVIFEAVTPDSTRVTTATRYVLTRKIVSSNSAVPQSDTAGFNGNEKGYFPRLGSYSPLECVATGELEKSILSVIK